METIEFFAHAKIPATVIHVISVILGMGAALTSDVLFSFFSKDKKLNSTEIQTLSILSKLVFYSLLLITLSGIFIFASDIQGYLASTKFLVKMSILGVLLMNGYVLNKYIWPHLLQKNFFVVKKERTVRKLAFACGAISVISWIAVCILGVLDTVHASYLTLFLTYLLIIFFGVIVSLYIEKKELN